jgi:diamine N-acetyltransferase
VADQRIRRAGKIELRRVDKSNWRAMTALALKPGQEPFVAPPMKSLAQAYIKPYGDNFDYRPYVICDGDAIVGYVSILCDPDSRTDYWVDDIMIDASMQGRGYGRIAMDAAMRLILREYPRCKAIRLTCFRANTNAAAMYQSFGFRRTGELNEEFQEPIWELSGAALDKYRRSIS